MVLLGYGFLIPLAIIGSFQILKKGDLTKREIFLLIWPVVQFLLLYSPFPFQRRMTAGLQVALAILATYGVFTLKDWLDQRIFLKRESQKVIYSPLLLIYLFFVFFSPTNFAILTSNIYAYFQGDESIYLKKEVREAMVWLKDNTEENSIILSSQKTVLKSQLSH